MAGTASSPLSSSPSSPLRSSSSALPRFSIVLSIFPSIYSMVHASMIPALLLFISLNGHYALALAWSYGNERQRLSKRSIIVSPFAFDADKSNLGELDDQRNESFDLSRRLTSKLISALTASAIIFGLTPNVLHHSCQAATYTTTTPSNIQTSLLTANDDDYINSLNLKPATESQPQIKLPASYKDPSKSNERRPLIQGLVYFAEQQAMGSSFPQDYSDDLLVLTVLPLNGDEILAGAKLPIASTRFPFLFQMYKENVLLKGSTKDVWLGTDGGEQQDVFVEARICPRDSAKFPCNEREQKRYAKGIAKLVSVLPGLEEGEIVRAPASLPLQ